MAIGDDTAHGLGTVDRATLVARRGANLVGWPVFALAFALFLRRGAESAASLFQVSLQDVRGTGGLALHVALVAVPACLIGGMAIGSFVAAHVRWHPFAVSMLTAVTFALVLGAVAETVALDGVEVLAHLVPVVAVPAAMVAARRTLRARAI